MQNKGTPLAVDNSRIAVIALSLKWRQRASVLLKITVLNQLKSRMNSDYYININS